MLNSFDTSENNSDVILKVLLILFVYNQKYCMLIYWIKSIDFVVLMKFSKGMKPCILHNGMIGLSDKFDAKV